MKMVSIRAHHDTHAAIRNAAAAEGMTLHQWVNSVLRDKLPHIQAKPRTRFVYIITDDVHKLLTQVSKRLKISMGEAALKALTEEIEEN